MTSTYFIPGAFQDIDMSEGGAKSVPDSILQKHFSPLTWHYLQIEGKECQSVCNHYSLEEN